MKLRNAIHKLNKILKTVTVGSLLVMIVSCDKTSKSVTPEDSASKLVTPDNYSTAEVDLTFAFVTRDVGSNKFRHDRSLIPLDKQPAVTMNQDTVYSLGVI